MIFSKDDREKLNYLYKIAYYMQEEDKLRCVIFEQKQKNLDEFLCNLNKKLDRIDSFLLKAYEMMDAISSCEFSVKVDLLNKKEEADVSEVN